ncbi:hypothetical protein XNW1_50002 [Xenorhabdus nematophila str. Websteri]|nr:hypothetical protein XNW1_3350002 [Xenorhabdus nematophila str. Websteri]CEF33762.1 hypothetical protein XNW1_50002 [Xenorhabdus nematophila str. Websteri]
MFYGDLWREPAPYEAGFYHNPNCLRIAFLSGSFISWLGCLGIMLRLPLYFSFRWFVPFETSTP